MQNKDIFIIIFAMCQFGMYVHLKMKPAII